MAISKKEFETLQRGDALVTANGLVWTIERTVHLPNGTPCVEARGDDNIPRTFKWIKLDGLSCIADSHMRPLMSLNDHNARVQRASI